MWWTSRQYQAFGKKACVNWRLDEDNARSQSPARKTNGCVRTANTPCSTKQNWIHSGKNELVPNRQSESAKSKPQRLSLFGFVAILYFHWMWEACTHEYWNGSLWVVNLIVQKQNDIHIFQIKEITAVENWIWERAAAPFSEPDRPMRSCAFHMPTPLKLVTLHQDLCCVNDCGRCQNSFSLLLEVVSNVQCFTFCPLRLCFALKTAFVSVLSQFSRKKNKFL